MFEAPESLRRQCSIGLISAVVRLVCAKTAGIGTRFLTEGIFLPLSGTRQRASWCIIVRLDFGKVGKDCGVGKT